MSNTTIVLPNPYTSLAWLPPTLASQLEIARYICCAVLGAYIWEVLMALPSEYKMFKEHRIGYSDVVYVSARISSAAYLVTTFVFAIAPVDNCQAVTVTAAIIGTLAVPLNCLLFFFRIRAVFSGSTKITLLFGFLWLCTFGASITAPFGAGAIHIGTSKNCISDRFKSFISAGLIAAAANDTLVFLFISGKLISSSFADGWKGRFALFFSGRGMGKVSRVLLQTGQLYYLATVSVNLVSMVCILTPSVPEVYRAVFTVPNLALLNAMACRVFACCGLVFSVTMPRVTQSPHTLSTRLLRNHTNYDSIKENRPRHRATPTTKLTHLISRPRRQLFVTELK
ncbi:hypothetical protein QCA50_004737 [Cerrena zonata]|uniref:Uncharacterized protein n=1 Tax=Cerrena zonata TaxID=2478898 RepID=A0AAW0GFG4_9APHY